MPRLISAQEVQKHNTLENLWLVVDGKVWNFTNFAPDHPGGAAIILKHAGRDATPSYFEVHAPGLIASTLPSSALLGTLDSSTIDSSWSPPFPVSSAKSNLLPSQENSTSTISSSEPYQKPPLSSLISTHDFRTVAEHTFSPKAWAFYSSAATDLNTYTRNSSTYAQLGLRPRILTNVANISTRTKMLGQEMAMPLYASPTALVKLAHPDGEKAIGRACKTMGIPQTISTQASFPVEEIVEALSSGVYGGSKNREGKEMPLFFQLYVDKDRSKSEKLLKQVESLGLNAVFVTVDAPVPGKREADERVKSDEAIVTPMSGIKAKNDAKGGALGRIMGSFVDSSLNWEDIAWLRRSTSLPLVLKGVQTAMDAKKAAEYGVEGIVLSNHGGRSLDTAPASIMLLLELQRCCPEVFDKLEVFVDGGVMRGTDIFKALCLGARACGVGRGFLWGLGYGQEGVEKYIEILRDELETTMKMCGVTNLSQVHPGLVNSLAVDHLVPTTEDHPYAKWRPKSRI